MSAAGEILRADIEIARRHCGSGRKNRAERHAWLRNRWNMNERIEKRKEELGDRYILRGGSADKWANWRGDNDTSSIFAPEGIR